MGHTEYLYLTSTAEQTARIEALLLAKEHWPMRWHASLIGDTRFVWSGHSPNGRLRVKLQVPAYRANEPIGRDFVLRVAVHDLSPVVTKAGRGWFAALLNRPAPPLEVRYTPVFFLTDGAPGARELAERLRAASGELLTKGTAAALDRLT